MGTDTSTSGVVKITVEFDDGVGKWQKTYDYKQTQPIVFANFKDRITDDLRRDLKIKDQLLNINAQIGKKFILTV